MNWPWGELGLPGPTGLPVIRRAYAERLKETRPEEKPEEFQRLHSAYQAACRLARRGAGDGASVGRSETGDGDAERDDVTGDGDMERETEKGQRETVEAEDTRESEAISAPREWDFERLFAEGAAEERGRRFQKLRELRRKNRFRYDAWNPPPSADPAEAALRWIAVSRAMDLLEELAFSGADAALWHFFVKSELFQYVRNYPDFVFALEDLLRERPEISDAGRRSLFRAYALDAATIPREYRTLYQLLDGNANGRGVSADGSASDGGANPWRKARGLSPIWNLIALLLLVACLSLMNACVDFLVREDLRKEQVLVWMAEDFGGEFVRMGKWELGKSFALLDTGTQIRFRARWDGPRDPERDKRGYVTDYAEARMFAELSAFASQWDWSISQRLEYEDSAPREDMGIYLSVPLTGAGEGVRALEALLSAVSRKGWYQELPPVSPLYLCWGAWSFCEYVPGEETFDGAAMQWYYERLLGPDLCRTALEETGLALSDIGEDGMLFPQEGAVTLEGRRFFHVTGTSPSPEEKPLFHYFLSEDGAELFCVPADMDFSGQILQSLRQARGQEYDVKGFPEKLRVFRASRMKKESP